MQSAQKAHSACIQSPDAIHPGYRHHHRIIGDHHCPGTIGIGRIVLSQWFRTDLEGNRLQDKITSIVDIHTQDGQWTRIIKFLMHVLRRAALSKAPQIGYIS
jgi:hypothetical protein